jgi:hypothetical protein
MIGGGRAGIGLLAVLAGTFELPFPPGTRFRYREPNS